MVRPGSNENGILQCYSSNIISPLSYVQFAPSHKILHIARNESRIYIQQFSPKCIHIYVQQFYMFPNPKNTTQSNAMICMGAILECTNSLEVLNCNFCTGSSWWFSKTYFWSATNQPTKCATPWSTFIPPPKNRSKEKEKQAMVHIG